MYPPDHNRESCGCTVFRKCARHHAEAKAKEAENRKHRPNPNPPAINDTIDSMIRGAKSYPGPKEEAEHLVDLLEDVRNA